MKNKEDLASEFMKILDEEARELLGEDKARELRKNINKRLKEKGLRSITWEDKND